MTDDGNVTMVTEIDLGSGPVKGHMFIDKEKDVLYALTGTKVRHIFCLSVHQSGIPYLCNSKNHLLYSWVDFTNFELKCILF